MNSNKKLRLSLKISLVSIISVLVFADLITWGYFQSSIYTLIQYISLFIVMIFVLTQIKYVSLQDIMFLIILLGMGLCIVMSSYLNKVNPAALRGSIYYALLIFAISMFLIEMGNCGMIRHVLLGGKAYLLVTLFVNDFLMIVVPDTFYNISGRDIGTTLLGNKFNVSYAHLMLMFILIFLEENAKKRDKKVFIYAVLLSVLCIYVDCSTTLLACWVFVILYFLPQHLRRVLSKPIVFISVFFLSSCLLMAFSGILTWGPVKYLILNVLHRDVTLTGRMQVYSYIYRIVSRQKWWGYGYETDIVTRITKWYANAQNAFWDFIICYGIITAIFLIGYMMLSVTRYFKSNTKNSQWIVFSMLYVYIFIGIGEITYSKQFFFYISLLWSICSTVKTRRKAKNAETRYKNFYNCSNL